jgi:flagellar hook assembly protein FlgD
VKIVVFDMIGRLVTTLVDQRMASGSHRVSWNGRDQNGGAVSSGVYFYHMQTEGFTATKKMVLIK